MRRLEGKTAVITGGAGGCGLATSLLFAENGASVVILDLETSQGLKVVAEIKAKGGDAIFLPTDVSNADQVKNSIDEVKVRYEKIDILMNHAGTIHVGPFLETTESDWDRIMNVNVKSMYLVTREILPVMLKNGGGNIINTSSISAVAGTPMEVLYCTSKSACHMFSRAIAVEYRSKNIRSNAICPGFIATNHGNNELDYLKKHGVNVSESDIEQMQGRLCEPEEVAKAALFLASDDSSFVNGTYLFVDNGYCAI